MTPMRPIVSIVFMAVLPTAGAAGQASETFRFEVASVKPSPPPQANERVFYGPARGGPGSRDPGRITWERAALRDVLIRAYDVQAFQINAPAWLSNERYDIAANVPAGATKEQVNVMWQNLLKERFGMVLHRESRQFDVHELTVANGGPKLKPTDLGPSPDPFTPAGGPSRLENGLPRMNGYGAIVTIMPDGRATMFGKGLTTADLASRLATQFGHPVIDKTGLADRYDFVLEYTLDLARVPLPRPPGADIGPPPTPPGDSAPLPDVAASVEKQLGLKLSRAKAALDVIVVDHAEKVPTEN